MRRPPTTTLYDRTTDQVSLNEIGERADRADNMEGRPILVSRADPIPAFRLKSPDWSPGRWSLAVRRRPRTS